MHFGGGLLCGVSSMSSTIDNPSHLVILPRKFLVVSLTLVGSNRIQQIIN